MNNQCGKYEHPPLDKKEIRITISKTDIKQIDFDFWLQRYSIDIEIILS